MILDWVMYPIVLGALCAGWGVLIEKASGTRLSGALVLPAGFAGVLVVSGLLTAFASTARAATPVCAVGGVAGLVWAVRERQWRRLDRWPALAAIGVVLAYGAPVLLYGHATFLGYLRLDDTSIWFNIVDHLMAHGRSVAGQPPSSYTLLYSDDVGPTYPLGAFVVLGVSRALVGIDVAWVFQPYLACCGAAIALCIYALAEPLIASRRRRALVAFLAAQPALLYGYSLWGGIKELTAAVLVALVVALAARAVVRPERGRELIALGISAGGLLITLSLGAGAWIAPAFTILLGAWLWRARRGRQIGRLTRARRWWRAPAVSSLWLAGITAACAVPLWIVFGSFFSWEAGLFSAGQTLPTKLGVLIQPLSGWQLAGIWTVGDFRFTAPVFPTAPLVGILVVAVIVALGLTLRRGQLGLAMYVVVALIACAIFSLAGTTPWVMAKALAISAPALLTAGLIGATMLWSRWWPAACVVAVLAFGVIWSNALAYHDAQLAPSDRLAELQHIGDLLNGRGPTLVDDNEEYADRHFLRAGAPSEPGDYANVATSTRTGAYADLDAFAYSTIYRYRSIVVSNSPVESRPPSIYKLVWAGRYYELYTRPARPAEVVIAHVPLGNVSSPSSIPPCRKIRALGAEATRDHAWLVAYQRPIPILAYGNEVLWPASWYNIAYRLYPRAPGTAVGHIGLAIPQEYELWLGGSFARGFQVSVDGRYVGQVKDELSPSPFRFIPVARLELAAGVHTLRLTYPSSNLAPGSGDSLGSGSSPLSSPGEFSAIVDHGTILEDIAFQPLQTPTTKMLTVEPKQAQSLCGRPLDWIEVVARRPL